LVRFRGGGGGGGDDDDGDDNKMKMKMVTRFMLGRVKKKKVK
jgi:hypothetical protein